MCIVQTTIVACICIRAHAIQTIGIGERHTHIHTERASEREKEGKRVSVLVCTSMCKRNVNKYIDGKRIISSCPAAFALLIFLRNPLFLFAARFSITFSRLFRFHYLYNTVSYISYTFIRNHFNEFVGIVAWNVWLDTIALRSHNASFHRHNRKNGIALFDSRNMLKWHSPCTVCMYVCVTSVCQCQCQCLYQRHLFWLTHPFR